MFLKCSSFFILNKIHFHVYLDYSSQMSSKRLKWQNSLFKKRKTKCVGSNYFDLDYQQWKYPNPLRHWGTKSHTVDQEAAKGKRWTGVRPRTQGALVMRENWSVLVHTRASRMDRVQKCSHPQVLRKGSWSVSTVVWFICSSNIFL